MEEANQFIVSGKKHLEVGEVVKAVAALEYACSLLAKEYGDRADECGEAFFLYGKALLDLARMDGSILVVPFKEEEEGDGEGEKDEPKDSNITGDKMVEEEPMKEAAAGEADPVTRESDKEEANGEMEEGEETSEKEEEEEEEEENKNFQLAWEKLEVAREIYERKDSEADKLMAAQIYFKLGEVYFESGDYAQAILDFQESVQLQLKHPGLGKTQLANAHSLLGVSYLITNDMRSTVEEFIRCYTVIKNVLVERQAPRDKPEDPEPRTTREEKLTAQLHSIMKKFKYYFAEANRKNEEELKAGEGDLSSGSTVTVASQSRITALNTLLSEVSEMSFKKRKPVEGPVKEGVKRVKL